MVISTFYIMTHADKWQLFDKDFDSEKCHTDLLVSKCVEYKT